MSREQPLSGATEMSFRAVSPPPRPSAPYDPVFLAVPRAEQNNVVAEIIFDMFTLFGLTNPYPF